MPSDNGSGKGSVTFQVTASISLQIWCIFIKKANNFYKNNKLASKK